MNALSFPSALPRVGLLAIVSLGFFPSGLLARTSNENGSYSQPVALATGTEVNLAWTDNADNETGFAIERKSGAGSFTLVTKIGAVSGAGNSGTYRDTGLSGGTTYTYRVRAENDVGVSAWSNEASATTTGSAEVAVVTHPVSMTSLSGSAAFFSVRATGGDISYQWLKNGVTLVGQTREALYLANVESINAGQYSVRVTNSAGTKTSDAATLTVATSGSARLANLSTRAVVGTGDNILVPGFGIQGTGLKTLLVRASGPKLGMTFGVQGCLPDPRLSFYAGKAMVGANDDWGQFTDQTRLENMRQSVGAFDLRPSTKDAAFLVSAQAGSPDGFTLPTTGVGDSTGVALVELYDADPAGSSAHIINLSARAQVGTDGDVLIPGFSISGDVALTLLIRGVGPRLGSFGVSGVLADPVMTLFRDTSGGPVAVAENDNWHQSPNAADLEAARLSVGAFSFDAGSGDSALLVALNPGNYTVQVAGKNRSIGLALVEIYVIGR